MQDEPVAQTNSGNEAFQALFSAAADALHEAVAAMEAQEPGTRALVDDAIKRGQRPRIVIECAPAELTAELLLAAADGSVTRLFACNVPRTATKTN